MIFKTYQNYLIKIFLQKVILISFIFFLISFILNLFEEISFFKNIDKSFLFIILLTFMNTPSILFEIFPFIFLISTQFFFKELIERNELEILKYKGIDNFSIIRLIFLTSFITGVLIILIFYNLSAKLKFTYLELKNVYAEDNKYLAVITENGLWIKDKFNEKISIINSSKLDQNYLFDTSIVEFDKNFDLIRIIEAKKIDITRNNWVIFNPTISKDNKTLKMEGEFDFFSNFNKEKINSLFENLNSLNLTQIYSLYRDYDQLGYSTLEIKSHSYKLFTYPAYISIISLLSLIIMFNIKRNKPLIFHIILGILISVIIYYIYYLINLLGINGNMPINISSILPLIILSLFIGVGLVRINEK